MWHIWHYGLGIELAQAEWISGNESVVGLVNRVVYLSVQFGPWEWVWVLKKKLA